MIGFRGREYSQMSLHAQVYTLRSEARPPEKAFNPKVMHCG